MKKNLALFAVLLVLLGYTYLKVIRPKEKIADKVTDQISLQNLYGIQVEKGEDKFEIRLKGDVWWFEGDISFPANQEKVLRNLSVIERSVSETQFPLEEDLYGFGSSQQKIRFEFKDGTQKKYVIGHSQGERGNLYLLEELSQQVLVVHNSWAQFFYGDQKSFLSATLPIQGKFIKKVTYKEKQGMKWKVLPQSRRDLEVIYLDQKKSFPKIDWLWFFQGMKQFGIKNISGQSPVDVKWINSLEIETDQGNIIFYLDSHRKRLKFGSKELFAELDPNSIETIDKKIKKAVLGD